MQKVNLIEDFYLERKLKEKEDDFVFMCNNLGFFVSQLEVEGLEYDVKIRFDYSYKSKDKEVFQGYHYFSGTLDKISSEIKEFYLLDQDFEFKRSRLL